MPVDGTTDVMKCSIHNFETKNQLEWYKHLFNTDGHFEEGRANNATIEPNTPSHIALSELRKVMNV